MKPTASRDHRKFLDDPIISNHYIPSSTRLRVYYRAARKSSFVNQKGIFHRLGNAVAQMPVEYKELAHM